MWKIDRLIRVGRTDVRTALGFFWEDRCKMYVAASPKDIDEWKKRGYSEADMLPMSELEDAFRHSLALKFISWCDTGCIVRQGARQVTFEYATHKSVIHIK